MFSNCGILLHVIFFFFKQKTAYEIVDCDWSSDVCSSDLETSGGRETANSPTCRHQLDLLANLCGTGVSIMILFGSSCLLPRAFSLAHRDFQLLVVR